jgi:hypothetical protein
VPTSRSTPNQLLMACRNILPLLRNRSVLKVGVGILPTSPVSGDGVRNLTIKILDGSSMGASAPCDQKKTCTSYAHSNNNKNVSARCPPGSSLPSCFLQLFSYPYKVHKIGTDAYILPAMQNGELQNIIQNIHNTDLPIEPKQKNRNSTGIGTTPHAHLEVHSHPASRSCFTLPCLSLSSTRWYSVSDMIRYPRLLQNAKASVRLTSTGSFAICSYQREGVRQRSQLRNEFDEMGYKIR